MTISRNPRQVRELSIPELASIGHDGDGVSRPIGQSDWLVPSFVSLEPDLWGDDWIVYAMGGANNGAGAQSRAVASGDLLGDFLGLNGQPANAILRFAERWGPLGFCQHGLPFVHNQPHRAADGTYDLGCVPRFVDEPDLMWESLAHWRLWVGAMRAAVEVAGALHKERAATELQWQPLLETRRRALYHSEHGRSVPFVSEEGFGRAHVETQRVLLAGTINYWLSLEHTRLQIDWLGEAPRIQHRTFGLFGALVLQVLAAVARSPGWLFCSACGDFFAPRRRPSRGERAYCKRCRASGASQRDASKDYRSRRTARR